MAHHRRVYEGVTEKIFGGYAQSVNDYVTENVFDRFDTPLGQDLLAFESKPLVQIGVAQR